MKFPYGISDFRKIMLNQYYFIDRTDRIRLIEEIGEKLLFLRPRRFGKSLLLSMLENYYDLARAGEFKTLFGDLAIGKNPTPLHNQYFVLKWDFSEVEPMGDASRIRQELHQYLNDTIQDFAVYYRDVLPAEIEIKPHSALSSFRSLLRVIRQTKHQLYLLIDEYDNFANEVMMAGTDISQSRYKALLQGEGSLKTVFKVLKASTGGRGLDRMFITGVSPMVLSDITSGFNIAKNIYLEPEFNDLCGFHESEIKNILSKLVDSCKLPPEKGKEALAITRDFYDGYCFHETSEFVYNPTLALYFLEYFQKTCQYPHEMLDNNLAMDWDKINYISRLPKGEQLIMDALGGGDPLTISKLANRFGVEDLKKTLKDEIFMSSLLYYFGILTFGGRTPTGKLILKIPNLVVQRLYVEQIQNLLIPGFKRKFIQTTEKFYNSGDMNLLCDFIENQFFKALDNRDYRWANELTIKTAFLTLLYDDVYYIMDSETALERGYADLTMILRPDMRKYPLLDILIEFKYINLPDAGLSGAEVKKMNRNELIKIALVQQKLSESEGKLQSYRQVLEDKYGEILRLHTYCVVAVGFDRLVWQEF